MLHRHLAAITGASKNGPFLPFTAHKALTEASLRAEYRRADKPLAVHRLNRDCALRAPGGGAGGSRSRQPGV